ncbi:MAG: preprotein translocase subunit SecA [Candidatus Portnoybacteria bacterium CG10_big_fil_rev_8_21_14_0_10_44_7]|uniref:Protein translocase subunit SecA n=1 Tax=Candidatus Portnoybacteria bacterium CG10_big_fil_rev_8_21_14_0_10_44_7 TaxID=1974816 RepID=A0A2M8KIP7_9BACT|nr:MAG: preprotein translocase subunit SecA [Candidatus Portnoybacteria bacterium CG10_big_fil_rev_8_21_14_0_10_44_7]
MSFLAKIFKVGANFDFAQYGDLLAQINKFEAQFKDFDEQQLKNKTAELRTKVNLDDLPKSLERLQAEAFALVRVAAQKTISQRHFDVQMIGAAVLHQGHIAEMKTGEGKTLAATPAIYLNALSGRGVHIVTVNDYLAKRDANWMGAIFHILGLSVGCIVHDRAFIFQPQVGPDSNEITIEYENLQEVPRQQAYRADVLYGTNNEFGFDYLRDNMVGDLSLRVQRGHYFAIVDEVDSILIDEARTPLIISAPDEESTKLYEQFSALVPRLKEHDDYNVDEKMKAVTLTDQGIARVEKILGMDIYNENGIRYVHHLEQALRAQVLFKKDRDYVVKDGEVIIVDEFTGRLMPGRRYSQGLHQALEAKEKVKVQKESRTLATITFQNYFRLYEKLAGMTGTAKTSQEEFQQVYNLEVNVIPTNKPMIRQDQPDVIYFSEKAKFNAIIGDIQEKIAVGRSVLVGTASIHKNELLHQYLQKAGIAHEVLNAKNHEREAQIIAQAGQPRAVTVATNMAGRGVDIKLETSVQQAGGLHVIGTERHEARRIDNQLRGRSGRQGDPGSSRFYLSLEDDLMRIFGPDRLKKMMTTLKFPQDQPIENRFISRAIENAQSKIEGFNFDARRHVLEYDDVMNRQRATIYRQREKVLRLFENKPIAKQENEKISLALVRHHASLDDLILDMAGEEIARLVDFHLPDELKESWNLEELAESVQSIMPLPGNLHKVLLDTPGRAEILEFLQNSVKAAFAAKKQQTGQQMPELEKAVLLRNIDLLWMEHLENMDHLKDSVRLRAYGQKDPLVEYKNEGWRLFKKLLEDIQFNVVNTIFKVQLAAQSQPARAVIETGASDTGLDQQKSFKEKLPAGNKKIGRNDPCPCGATKPDGTPVKFKKCCGK